MLEQNQIVEEPMQTKPTRLWISVLLLGWLFDFLFWKHAPGISFAIYAVVTLIAGFMLLRLGNIHPAKWTLALIPLILFCAAMTFIRLEPLSLFGAYAFSLLLLAVLAATFQGGRWISYGIGDYFLKFLDLLASCITRPLTFIAETQQIKREAGEGEKTKKPSIIWPVARGILLAVPVVAFFAALLSSADPIFAARVQDLIKLFRLENLPEYIFRGIYICALAYGLAGVILHAAARSKDEKLLGEEKPLLAPFFGFTEAAVVLGSVILLFGLFVTIQFQYFFGGQANIHIEGYTYAEYVHKGFGELVTVAFFALLLFLGLSAVVKRDTVLRQKVFSGLGALLFTMVAVMLVSAYQRLILYEGAYGFTRLRTYIHVFMIWVAVLLAVVVALDLLRRQRAFALAVALASLGFAGTLMVLNVDSFIVQQNVQRAAQGQDLDVGYLASLSSDGVPALVDLYQAPALTPSTRDGIGAVLACFQAGNGDKTRQDISWQSFHLSKYWADTALESMKNDLKNYPVNTSTWLYKVKTPLGKEYKCYSFAED
jgi:hypothetical protein